ncbi:MAG TPA: NAD(P)H-hydrate epimerase, partial [Firmicutes bacterium]|nr:NAD(P)H-hydrate epimerase [Bacillota bacterium]
MKVVTAEEMKRLDALAQQEGAVPGLILMERAGEAVCGQALTMLPRPWPADVQVLVLCGKGNNGGDGLVAARRLSQKGLRVRVLVAAVPGELKGDAATNLQMAQAEERLSEGRLHIGFLGGKQDWEETVRQALGEATLVIDALLGTGIQGGARGSTASIIEMVNQAAAGGR